MVEGSLWAFALQYWCFCRGWDSRTTREWWSHKPQLQNKENRSWGEATSVPVCSEENISRRGDNLQLWAVLLCVAISSRFIWFGMMLFYGDGLLCSLSLCVNFLTSPTDVSTSVHNSIWEYIQEKNIFEVFFLTFLSSYLQDQNKEPQTSEMETAASSTVDERVGVEQDLFHIKHQHCKHGCRLGIHHFMMTGIYKRVKRV